MSRHGSEGVAGTVADVINPVTGYKEVEIDGEIYESHRIAFLYMRGFYPTENIIHLDGNKLNNAWKNLCLESEMRGGSDGLSQT